MSDTISEKNSSKAVAFLNDKLNAHRDRITIEQYDYLFKIDKNKMIISSALEYATDAKVKTDCIAEMDSLIDSVGNKIDALQAEYDTNVSNYDPDTKKQIETILRDLQIVHFGLIAILMVKKDFSKTN